MPEAQNISAQERQDIETKIDAIITKDTDPSIKPMIYSLMLINIVGIAVLEEAKIALKQLLDQKRESEARIPSEQQLKLLINVGATPSAGTSPTGPLAPAVSAPPNPG